MISGHFADAPSNDISAFGWEANSAINLTLGLRGVVGRGVSIGNHYTPRDKLGEVFAETITVKSA